VTLGVILILNFEACILRCTHFLSDAKLIIVAYRPNYVALSNRYPFKMKHFVSSFFLLAAAGLTGALNLRGDVSVPSRQLQSYYFSTTDVNVLGNENKRAVLDNPMKGLLTSPRYTGFNTPSIVPSTLEFYYIGLDE
jgi:hypothetical protein